LSSCASTPQSRNIKANGLGDLPLEVELTDVPFYPQTKYQCGPAALATVLQAQSINTIPEKLSKQVYIPGRKGSLQIELTVAARRHGMLPYELEPRLIKLFTEIAGGNPVLILQNLGFEWFPRWHYAVVIGYDANRHEIILRSGTSRRKITPLEVFERTWERADYWALVITPIGEIPKTAKPLRYLQTAYAFEETGSPELALKAYQSAGKLWPDEAIIWMALGNMALDSQDWPKAIKAINTPLNIEPESIIGWNNLAYALNAYGCGTQAKKALQCGMNLQPADLNLQDSWSGLISRSFNSDQKSCTINRCY
jgi:hypothetical protein